MGGCSNLGFRLWWFVCNKYFFSFYFRGVILVFFNSVVYLGKVFFFRIFWVRGETCRFMRFVVIVVFLGLCSVRFV